MAGLPTSIHPAEGHRLWAETYDTDLNPLLSLERRVLEPLLPDLSGKCVVDVGCGTGRWTAFAQARGANVGGFDLTPEMLRRAAAKQLAGKLVCSDAGTLPLPNQVADLVLCSFCISYVDSIQQVFQELARITCPGGRIVVSDVHPAAITAGWKRTFRSDGRVYEMQINTRGRENPLRAGLKGGLSLWRVLEPRFAEPERRFFERAGKAESFEAASSLPALLITLWDR